MNTLTHLSIQNQFSTNLEASQLINPFQPSVAFHIETTLVIFTANQITGFYLKCNNGLKWVKAVNQWAGFYMNGTVSLNRPISLCLFLWPNKQSGTFRVIYVGSYIRNEMNISK